LVFRAPSAPPNSKISFTAICAQPQPLKGLKDRKRRYAPFFILFYKWTHQ
jgi:hypothetical protein